MKNNKKFLWILVSVICIIILIYSIYTNIKGIKNDFSFSKKFMEHYELNKTIYYTNYDDAPKRLGYIEEKDGKFYEGTLESKSYSQFKPGETKIEYTGRMYEAKSQNLEEGITWIEISIYQQVDNVDDPPLQKDVVMEFKDRFYKGTLDLELDKKVNVGEKAVPYFGILYYDSSLTPNSMKINK